MPKFKYKALNLEGYMVRGQEEAENRQDLYAKLRNHQLFLVKAHEVIKTQKERKSLPLKELAVFCRELGTMLDSGMDILSVLDVLVESAEKKEQKDLLNTIIQNLHTGMLLSDALEMQGKTFPGVMIYMVKAGEASGRLSEVMLNLAQRFEKENKIEKKIKTAMIYPSILTGVSVIVVIAIFTIIMPTFQDVLENVELPTITKWIMFSSNWFIEHLVFVIVGVIVLCGVIAVGMKTPQFQEVWSKIKLRLPKIGRFTRIIYTSRFARSLGMLYASGVNIITAVELSASTLNNVYLEKQMVQVAQDLREGKYLSTAMQKVEGLDYKLIRGISVGEESGKLDNILSRLSDEYDEDAMQAVNRLLALMEPLLIIVLGIVVMIIVVSVLLPIYSMYSSY